MGKLRTANNRRNRAMRNSIARSAVGAPSETVVVEAATTSAKDPS